MNQRASSIKQPKPQNAWDLLYLNDFIRNKIEQYEQKQQKVRIQNAMRNYYDQQVEEKKQKSK